MGEPSGGGGDRYGGGWREGDMAFKDSSDAEKISEGTMPVGVIEDKESNDGLGNTGDATFIPGLCTPIGIRYFFFSIKYFSP
jgi:hypothetical protein